MDFDLEACVEGTDGVCACTITRPSERAAQFDVGTGGELEQDE